MLCLFNFLCGAPFVDVVWWPHEEKKSREKKQEKVREEEEEAKEMNQLDPEEAIFLADVLLDKCKVN